MIENIFTATPAEIDTEIARLQEQQASVTATVARAHMMLTSKYSTESERDEARAAYSDAMGKIRVLEGLVDALQAEFGRRGGWMRYYVVNNNNGHLHTNTHCQNTYDTTEWVWMPGMSGMTKAQAVVEGGSLTCLSCFPEFRTEIELGREPRFETPRMRKTREEREAAAAKKAEKTAKATANAVYGEDGKVLQLPDFFGKMQPVKSEISCNRLVMQAATDLAFYGTHPDEDNWKLTIDLGLKALARKRGTTVEHERALVDAKIAKKMAK